MNNKKHREIRCFFVVQTTISCETKKTKIDIVFCRNYIIFAPNLCTDFFKKEDYETDFYNFIFFYY